MNGRKKIPQSSEKNRRVVVGSVGDSPGDSGILSGVLENGVLVLVGYDESQDDWKRGHHKLLFPGINKETGEVEGHYEVLYPHAQPPSNMIFNSIIVTDASGEQKQLEEDEIPAFMAYEHGTIGAYAGDANMLEFAGQDMPYELCSAASRPVDRDKKGRPKDRRQMPKKCTLPFIVNILGKLHIAPPDKPSHGVVLVGERAGYFDRMKKSRVKWVPVQRADLQDIRNSAVVDRVFSGSKASEQDQTAMTELLRQLALVRPSFNDAASKLGVSLSDFLEGAAIVARADPKTPVQIEYSWNGKWKSWSNRLITETKKRFNQAAAEEQVAKVTQKKKKTGGKKSGK